MNAFEIECNAVRAAATRRVFIESLHAPVPSRVRPHVHRQLSGPRERIAARLADMRLLPRMRPVAIAVAIRVLAASVLAP